VILARADHGGAGAGERAQLLLQITAGFGRLLLTAPLGFAVNRTGFPGGKFV